jgi:hypothetical protein
MCFLETPVLPFHFFQEQWASCAPSNAPKFSINQRSASTGQPFESLLLSHQLSSWSNANSEIIRKSLLGNAHKILLSQSLTTSTPQAGISSIPPTYTWPPNPSPGSVTRWLRVVCATKWYSQQNTLFQSKLSIKGLCTWYRHMSGDPIILN